MFTIEIIPNFSTPVPAPYESWRWTTIFVDSVTHVTRQSLAGLYLSLHPPHVCRDAGYDTLMHQLVRLCQVVIGTNLEL
jgi:hypothetical protein